MLFCALVFVHIKWMIIEIFLLEVPGGSRVLLQHLLCISETDAVTGCCVTRESLEGADSVGTLFWERGHLGRAWLAFLDNMR